MSSYRHKTKQERQKEYDLYQLKNQRKTQKTESYSNYTSTDLIEVIEKKLDSDYVKLRGTWIDVDEYKPETIQAVIEYFEGLGYTSTITLVGRKNRLTIF